ncbi:hypothetical protein MPLB_250102 [Mesorhizobium sp. ORS 3324]|nr:hypothetical protein MPLB_250102 [Mesorhizobium sp. ORS 3324]
MSPDRNINHFAGFAHGLISRHS